MTAKLKIKDRISTNMHEKQLKFIQSKQNSYKSNKNHKKHAKFIKKKQPRFISKTNKIKLKQFKRLFKTTASSCKI